jgi:hypothetical protein
MNQPLRMTLLPALTLATLLATAHPATAQPAPQPVAPSPQQAQALETQIHDALTALTGGGAIPARPVELTPAGDHYLVRIPLAELGQVEPPDAAFTAQARMLDGSRWALDDQQFPPQFKLATTIEVPDGTAAKNPSPDGHHPETVLYDIRLGHQDAHAVFDPTFATATDSTATIAPVDILHTGGMSPAVTHMDQVATQTTVRPVGAGRIDLLNDATAQGYATQSLLPDGSPFKMTAQALHIVSALNGVAHDKVLPVIQQAVAVSKLKASPGDAPAQAAVNAGLRQVLTAAMGLLTGGRIDESATGIRFDAGGHVGAIAKLELTVGGNAPQDMLSATMGFTMDGLVIDGLPPTLAAYVPTHVTLQPTLSNLSTADLTKMAMDATAPGATTVPPADVAALYAHGGINIGFDALGLDIAGTRFSGTGNFTMTGPQAVTGQAEIDAQGLDALIAKAQTDPMLQRGVPVIIFLKGIAHTNGDQAVWQISVAGGKILVNGVDLSAMAGAVK